MATANVELLEPEEQPRIKAMIDTQRASIQQKLEVVQSVLSISRNADSRTTYYHYFKDNIKKHIKETMAILDAQGTEYSMLPEDILQKTIYDHVYCTYI